MASVGSARGGHARMSWTGRHPAPGPVDEGRATSRRRVAHVMAAQGAGPTSPAPGAPAESPPSSGAGHRAPPLLGGVAVAEPRRLLGPAVSRAGMRTPNHTPGCSTRSIAQERGAPGSRSPWPDSADVHDWTATGAREVLRLPRRRLRRRRPAPRPWLPATRRSNGRCSRFNPRRHGGVHRGSGKTVATIRATGHPRTSEGCPVHSRPRVLPRLAAVCQSAKQWLRLRVRGRAADARQGRGEPRSWPGQQPSQL